MSPCKACLNQAYLSPHRHIAPRAWSLPFGLRKGCPSRYNRTDILVSDDWSLWCRCDLAISRNNCSGHTHPKPIGLWLFRCASTGDCFGVFVLSVPWAFPRCSGPPIYLWDLKLDTSSWVIGLKRVPAFVKKVQVRATNIQFPCCNQRHHFYDGHIGTHPCRHRKRKYSI